jgi:hypothetical protein
VRQDLRARGVKGGRCRYGAAVRLRIHRNLCQDSAERRASFHEPRSRITTDQNRGWGLNPDQNKREEAGQVYHHVGDFFLGFLGFRLPYCFYLFPRYHYDLFSVCFSCASLIFPFSSNLRTARRVSFSSHTLSVYTPFKPANSSDLMATPSIHPLYTK